MGNSALEANVVKGLVPAGKAAGTLIGNIPSVKVFVLINVTLEIMYEA